MAVCTAVALGLWVLYKIRAVLLILLAGVAIAYGLAPLVRAFSGNRARLRPLGITLAYLSVFVGLVAAGLLGLSQAADDARAFATTLPATVQRVDGWLTQTAARFRQVFQQQGQAPHDSASRSILAARVQSFAGSLGQYAAGAAAFGQSFLTFTAAAALALVVSVFLLADPAYFHRQLLAVVPSAIKRDVETLLREIDLVLAAYIRGQIIIAVVVGLVATLGMALLRVKYDVILGLFTAVTQFIPQVGGAIGLVVAVAVSALQSPVLAIAVFVLYMVLYQLSGNVLGPLVMGRAVQLHPLVILLATMVGAVLGGVVGLLLSVPVAAVLKVIWNFFYPRLAARWGLEPAAEARASEGVSRDQDGHAARIQP